MDVKNTIQRFDEYLCNKQLQFSATIIGGSALVILEIISRDTRDVDCLIEIPENVKKASVEFARLLRNEGVNIIDDWLNSGPLDLTKDLPQGWQLRISPLYKGVSLDLQTLGRGDLLKTKLFAMCDRQQDIDDCILFKPTLAELKEAFIWVKKRDANPLWEKHVFTSFCDLSQRLGYEFSV